MKLKYLSNHSQFPLAFAMLLLASLATPTASGVTERNLQKTFSVSPGGKLVLDVDRGSIEVSITTNPEVALEVFRKANARNESREQEILHEHEVSFSQDGDTVTVRAKGKRDSYKLWNSGHVRFEVRYVISVPEKFNADLKTSGGGISVADLIGEVKVKTSGGGLKLGKIQGPVLAHTSGGGIRLAGCKGTVNLETSGGGIEIGQGEGALSAQSSGGPIHINKFKGDIVAKTSGGGITCEQVEGHLDASTSGGSISATLAGQPTGDCRLETSGGSITVKVSETAALDINASTSGGSVNSDLPVTVVGEKKQNALKGKLNGGGKALLLHTSGGSIHLRRL